MSILIVSFTCFFVLATYYLATKGSVFGINLGVGDYSGFFVLYQLLVYVFPAVIVLNILNIDNVWVAFKVQQESVLWISMLILFSVLLFIITLGVLSRLFSRYLLLKEKDQNPTLVPKGIDFVRTSILFSLFLIVLSYVFFGVGHSFSAAIISGESISSLRFSIKNNEALLVKLSKHLFTFIAPLLSAIIASPLYRERKTEALVSFVLVLFVASWGGNKSPVLVIFLVSVFSYLSFNRVKFTSRGALKFLFSLSLFLFLVYQLVLLQYEHTREFRVFIDYFFQRVFIAQIIGVYEQFNLWLYNPEYIWHGVPFASFFVEFPIHQKDLMMISEDRYDSESIGIKNTLFIAEAYGMLGWVGVLLSPVIMAVNFALSYIWLVFLLNHFVFQDLKFVKLVLSLSVFSYVGITGGFSDLMLFKITIMMTVLLSPFVGLTFFKRKFAVTF